MRHVIAMDTAAGTAVTTTTEAALAEYHFGVGELTAGRVIEWELGGTVTAHNASDTLTIRVRFGTSATPTSNTEILLGDAINVNVNDIIHGWGRIFVQSPTRYVFTALVDNPHATGATRDTTSAVVVFTAVADTSYYLQITADWSATAANSVRAECWAVFGDEV